MVETVLARTGQFHRERERRRPRRSRLLRGDHTTNDACRLKNVAALAAVRWVAAAVLRMALQESPPALRATSRPELSAMPDPVLTARAIPPAANPGSSARRCIVTRTPRGPRDKGLSAGECYGASLVAKASVRPGVTRSTKTIASGGAAFPGRQGGSGPERKPALEPRDPCGILLSGGQGRVFCCQISPSPAPPATFLPSHRGARCGGRRIREMSEIPGESETGQSEGSASGASPTAGLAAESGAHGRALRRRLASSAWRERRLEQTGSDPDPRFTFANERTFLAWNRTALALIAAGLAAAQFLKFNLHGLRLIIAVPLIVLGAGLALASFLHWEDSERAMRLRQPLRYSWMPRVLTGGIMVIALLGGILAVVDRLAH